MKLTRRSLVLLAVAALLAVLNVWDAGPAPTAAALPSVPAAATDTVVAIQISTPIEKLRVERGATEKGAPGFDAWNIVTPLQYPADSAQVRTLLKTFADPLPMDAFVDSGNHEDYGVDDQNGLLVELYVAGQEIPGAALVVGKTAAGPSTFVRLPGSDDVYRADVGGRARYARPAAEWRDKVAIEVERTKILGLTIARGAETLRFTRVVTGAPLLEADPDGGPPPARWALEGAPFATDSDTVDATIKTLARIRAGEVHNPDYEAGFDAPAAVATLTLDDGTARTITLGGRVVDGAAFVRVDGRDEVFRTAASVGRALAQPVESFRDRRLLAFKRADVASVAYSEGGLTVVLAQSDDNATWAITQPPNMDADQKQALYTVNTLASLRAAALAPDATFAASGARFEVRMRDGGTVTVQLGQREPDAEGRPLVRVRISGKEGVYLLQEAAVAELLKAFGRG